MADGVHDLGLVIRLARAEEAELVHAVMQDAYREYADGERACGAFDETPACVRELLTSRREQAALCFLGDEAVGAVRFRWEEGLYFKRLAVRRAYQGRGIAKALLRWLEEQARQSGAARLWCKVWADHARNLQLYTSAGFVSAGELVRPGACDCRASRIVKMVKHLA